MLQKEVEDVTLAMDEEVLEDLRFGLGNQGLNNFVEITAKDGLNNILVEEVEELVHYRIIILRLLACLVNVIHVLGANLIALLVKRQVSFRGSRIPVGPSASTTSKKREEDPNLKIHDERDITIERRRQKQEEG